MYSSAVHRHHSLQVSLSPLKPENARHRYATTRPKRPCGAPTRRPASQNQVQKTGHMIMGTATVQRATQGPNTSGADRRPLALSPS